jgi:predicted metal-dependent enzyme (double-stranded beta helix superfamily)
MSQPRTKINPAQVALQLAAQQSLWRPLVRYDPLSRYYVRLAAERDFEAWLLTWVPGQGTEWHDHGGSAGAFAIVQGTLTELHATVAPDRAPQIDPVTRVLPAGALRTFGRRHLHRVSNHDLEPAVSLHVYAPALSAMNEYVRRGNELNLVVTQQVGVNW